MTEARTWTDTPWLHQGRLIGVGVDCVGLVLETARGLGLTDMQVADYPRRPDATLRKLCDEHLDAIPLYEAREADVLLFAWNNSPVHMAIITGYDSETAVYTIIHAYAINRKVVEHRVDDRWLSAVACAYHVPGIE